MGSDFDGKALRAGIDLHAIPESVPAARHFVTSMLAVWDCDDPDQVVEILTGEVVTNAVRHARGAIRVEASLVHDDVVRVETSDEFPDATVAQPAAPTAEGGRGILIVQTLARRWGVDKTEFHKVVWFESAVVPRNGAAP